MARTCALACAWIFVLSAVHAVAATFNPMVRGTGRDLGQQDGIFDTVTLFPDLNSTQVNNNGFSSSRHAFEFDISSIQKEPIVAATLELGLDVSEGPRSIELHGFTGDGALTTFDFELTNLIEHRTFGPLGSTRVRYDVTEFMQTLTASGEGFVGFGFREEPPNHLNFTVISTEPSTNAQPGAPQIELRVSVPEPSSWALCVVSLACLIHYRNKRIFRMCKARRPQRLVMRTRDAALTDSLRQLSRKVRVTTMRTTRRFDRSKHLAHCHLAAASKSLVASDSCS